MLNWLPPLAVRCERWFIPSNDASSCGPPRVMALGRAGAAALVAAWPPPARAPCWRAKLRSDPRAPDPLGTRLAPPGPPSPPISVGNDAGAPGPVGGGL